VFNSSVTFFRDWSEQRRARREHDEIQKLEQSLVLGGSAVKQEYDSDFARLGPRFAVGDGKIVHLFLKLLFLINA
jgi:hypothetical protein